MNIGGHFFNLTYIFSTGGSTYLVEEPHTFSRPAHLVNGGPVDGEPVDMGDWLECHQDISTGLPRIFEPSTFFWANFIRDLSPPVGNSPKWWWKGKGRYPPPKNALRNIQVSGITWKLMRKQFARFVFSKGHEVSQFALHPLKMKRLETSQSSNFFKSGKSSFQPFASPETNSSPPWK